MKIKNKQRKKDNIELFRSIWFALLTWTEAVKYTGETLSSLIGENITSSFLKDNESFRSSIVIFKNASRKVLKFKKELLQNYFYKTKKKSITKIHESYTLLFVHYSSTFHSLLLKSVCLQRN